MCEERVFGSLRVAVAFDIYHTNPSMARLQYLAEGRKCYQAEDNNSHPMWWEEDYREVQNASTLVLLDVSAFVSPDQLQDVKFI